DRDVGRCEGEIDDVDGDGCQQRTSLQYLDERGGVFNPWPPSFPVQIPNPTHRLISCWLQMGTNISSLQVRGIRERRTPKHRPVKNSTSAQRVLIETPVNWMPRVPTLRQRTDSPC